MSRFRFQGRTEQSKASQHRRRDAEVLRESGRWRGAMYMMGYAVECALKAKLLERYDLWHLDDLAAKVSQRLNRHVDLFTHGLQTLMNFAEAGAIADRNASASWARIVQWNVDWRYSPDEGQEQECSKFFEHATVVLRYIRNSV